MGDQSHRPLAGDPIEALYALAQHKTCWHLRDLNLIELNCTYTHYLHKIIHLKKQISLKLKHLTKKQHFMQYLD